MLSYQSWHEKNQDLTPVMLPILTWEKTWVESSIKKNPVIANYKSGLVFPNNFRMEFSIFVYCKFPVQKYIQHCNVGGHALLVLLTASERWMAAHIKSLGWPQEKRMWSLECHLVLLNMNGLPSSMTSQ